MGRGATRRARPLGGRAWLMLLTITALVAGCGGSEGDGGAEASEVEALQFDAVEASETTSDTPEAAEALAEAVEDATPEDSASETLEIDEADDNEQPGFDALPGVTVKMGHQASLDLAPYIDDAEDEDATLSLSWSAAHVGLRDDEGHVLLVVGPVDWFGEEVIELTVTDSGGLSASSMLTVLVEEVVPPEPITPPPECPKTSFTYTADGPAGEVLVAGTFNDWAAGGDKALALSDPEGDKTWSLELDLAPGTWLYKFVVDGNWLHDEANPETADDGYGGLNSVLVVPPCGEEVE